MLLLKAFLSLFLLIRVDATSSGRLLRNAWSNSWEKELTDKKEIIKNDYLSKFNIYCLINNGRNEEAQLVFDLKKELGFKDEYFEKKLEYLFGYTKNPDLAISEKTILDFHLAHKSNPKFFFETKKTSSSDNWVKKIFKNKIIK